MTEQERKNLVVRVKSNKYLTRIETDYIVDALEEIQQYRAIGTVEECRAYVEKLKKAMEKLEEKANTEGLDCEEYEDEIKMQCYRDAIEIVKGGGVDE